MRDKAIDEIGGSPVPAGAAGDCHRAAPGARALARVHPSGGGARRSADGRGSGEALAMVQDATAEDVIFITGSLFLVAEARELLVL